MTDDILVYVREADEATTGDETTQSVVEAVSNKKLQVVGNRIVGAHILGFKAKNIVKPNKEPYSYDPVAVKEAVALYNNIDLYVGHTKTPTVGLRDPSEKIGFIENATFKEGVGAVGDLVLNEKHPCYDSFIWWAENKPEKLMLSHEAKCSFSATKNTMTKIHKVDCVAFVSEGSTTTTLVKEGVIGDKIEKERMLSIVLETFDAIKWDILYPLGKTLTQEQKAVLLAPVIKDLLDEVSKLVPKTTTTTEANTTVAKEENNMEFKDITLETLAKHRKDLIDVITTQAIEAHISNEKAVTEAVKDIPEDYRSDLFVQQVREAVVAKNTKLVTDLVADRATVAAAAEKAKDVTAVEAPVVTPRTPTQQKPAAKFDVKSVAALAKRK